MVVTVAIMHTPWVEARRLNVRTLLRRLQQDPDIGHFEVIDDKSRAGPWVTAQKAWLAGILAGGDYHAVIQDDVAIPVGFGGAVKRAIDVFPDHPIGLYMGGQKEFRDAKDRGCRWIRKPEGVYGQGIVLPTGTIGEMIRWCQRYVKPEWPHDDYRIGLWIEYGLKRPAMMTIPTLVDHLDNLDSVMGHGKGIHAGKRHSAYYLDDVTDVDFEVDDTARIAVGRTSNLLSRYREWVHPDIT